MLYRMWMLRVVKVIVMVFVLGCVGMSLAQEVTPTPEPPLIYGQVVAGFIDNRTPLQTYTFDGQRGEYIDITVTLTSGNLDAILTVLDDTGAALITRDDSTSSANPNVHLLRIPRNGRYTVVVARFGYAVGTTAGAYEIVIQRVGVSFESGSALRYGDTVVNTISDEQPIVYYSFRAERGDLITLTMRHDSGDLDPLLRLVDTSRRILAENDDMPNATSKDAQIGGYLIEQSGAYLIVATRYGEAAGQTTGDFILTLQRGADSGDGVSPQVAIPLQPNRPIENDITTARTQLYYSFQARRDDIITLRMSRINGNLDSYLALSNAGFNELTANDDVADGNQNAQITEFRIPADGTYYVLATRFSGTDGNPNTTGRFRLELVVVGNAFEDIAEGANRMVIGTTAAGRITDDAPSVLYAFYGVGGDVITAAAIRSDGSLQPVVDLLDETQRVLFGGTSDAERATIERFTLPRTGVYYLRVSRVNSPITSGGFTLTLAQRFD